MIVWPAGVPDLASLLVEATRTFGPETAFLELDRSDVRSQRTYDQVRREAQAFAAWLEDLGVGKGDRVAIWMSNQPRWGIAALGAFLRGAVVVPLDARARPDEVAGGDPPREARGPRGRRGAPGPGCRGWCGSPWRSSSIRPGLCPKA
jgi:hypothetical protein